MKANTHPTYYPDAKVTCSCGNTFTTGSTLPEITVDICSACHPFFTGEMKFVDTQGRVEKFEAMRKRAQQLQSKLSSKKKTASDENQDDTNQNEAKTLREMMQDVAKQTQPTKKS